MLTVTDDCIRCRKCVKVCPMYIIEMGEEKPELTSRDCLRCGHCEAVCPEDALRNSLMPEAPGPFLPEEGPVLDPDAAELFLRARRSNRCFLRRQPPRELTEHLLDIGRYAPTGSNSQGVSYLVVSTEALEALRQLALKFFRTSPDPFIQGMYEKFLEPGKDRLLRHAPMAILALTRKDNPYTTRNAIYALTYVEAFAPSLGLSTCWAGFLERYTSADEPEMRSLLELPDGLVVSGALLYGYPEIRYHRAAGRNPLEVFWR